MGTLVCLFVAQETKVGMKQDELGSWIVRGVIFARFERGHATWIVHNHFS